MASQGALKTAATESVADEITRLRAENARLLAQKATSGRLSLKVSEKGAVSLYGLGRFPATYYGEQWKRLLDHGVTILAFIEEHGGELSTKG